MATPFHCSLVTPERSVLEADVVYADLPAHDGQLGVLNNRAPLLVKLGVGKLRLQMPDGATRRFVLDGGFAQMNRNHLILLCERAYTAEEVNADDANRRLTEAQALPSADSRQRDKRNHDLAVAKQLIELAH
jgi:F-type H+-transporting ATPase subunit epsilon